MEQITQTNEQPLDQFTDINKIIQESKNNLATEKPKRKRATKEEMQARRAGAPQANPTTGQVSQQQGLDLRNVPTQDFTIATVPILKLIDDQASKFIARDHNLKASQLKSDNETLTEAAKNLNQPLSVIAAHMGASSDPLSAAYFAVGFTLGSLFLSKYLQAGELVSDKANRQDSAPSQN